jgi:murein DD-endopeptidase MepM/ murein hydrolase activator NlpD
MPAFDLEMSSPMPSGFVKSLGGPGTGGHVGTDWYIRFGMDFGARVGIRVFAAFDGHVTTYHPHDPKSDSAKVYGAQIFVRSNNDMMGGFYQHITSVPAAIRSGAKIARGDHLGEVYIIPGSGMPPHLHWALVEIIGGAPGGRYVGVDLNSTFIRLSNTSDTKIITFNQNSTPPTVS